jgi:outer membrane protein
MKKLRLIIVAAVLMAVALSASAQTKIASVDLNKLLKGYYKTKMADAALNKDYSDSLKDLKDMNDSLDKAKKDYNQLLEQANDQVISADERERRKDIAAEKAKEINSSQVAIEQYQRQAESQFSTQKQRMVSNLLGEIQKAVADKAKAGGYGFVVNSANADAFVYSSPDTDITDAVLAELNAGAPIDVAQPPATSPNSP